MQSKDHEPSTHLPSPPDNPSGIEKTVKRNFGGRKRRLPPVEQGTFINFDKPKSTEIVDASQLQANTGKGLRRIQPREEVIIRPTGDIAIERTKKALGQQAAIVRHARLKSRRPK